MTETHTSITDKTQHPGDLTTGTTPRKKAPTKKAAKPKTAPVTAAEPPSARTASTLADRVEATWAKAHADAAVHAETLAGAQADVTEWTARLREIEDARDTATAAWSRGDVDAEPPAPGDIERIEVALRGARQRLARAEKTKPPMTDQRVAELLAPIARQHDRIPVYTVPAVPDDLEADDLAAPVMFVTQQSPTIDKGDGSVGLSTYSSPGHRGTGSPVQIVLIRDELYAPLDGQALRHRLNAARVKIKDPAFGRITGDEPINVTTHPSDHVPGYVEDVARFEVLSAHPAAPVVPNLSAQARAEQVRNWVCGGIARAIQFNWKAGTGVAEQAGTTSESGTITDTYRVRLVLQLPDGMDDARAGFRLAQMTRDDLGALVPNIGTVSAAAVESVIRELRPSTANFSVPSFDLVARTTYSVTRKV